MPPHTPRPTALAAFLSRFPDAERLGGGSIAADGAVLTSPHPPHADIVPTPWLLKAGLAPEEARGAAQGGAEWYRVAAGWRALGS